MLAAAVASSGLRGRFTHILSVDQVKVYKPDPRVYALVPKTLGLPKEALVFVSSNAFDVMGACRYDRAVLVVWLYGKSGSVPFRLSWEADTRARETSRARLERRHAPGLAGRVLWGRRICRSFRPSASIR
jgi:2-haloacid dehalogenase